MAKKLQEHEEKLTQQMTLKPLKWLYHPKVKVAFSEADLFSMFLYAERHYDIDCRQAAKSSFGILWSLKNRLLDGFAATYQLKPGDRFSEIPAAWHGPGVVTESRGTRTLFSNEFWTNHLPLSKDRRHRVDGTWRIEFNNDKVVNPPGVFYCNPEVRVRLLNRPSRRTR